MAEQLEIPSFEFGAFYYPDILESLIIYKRRHVPELTDESAFEPFMQFLRANALVGHLNNVLLDQVANEATLPTCRLPETARNMLRLIDYELSPATPAQTDLVYRLSRVFLVETEISPGAAQFATQRDTGDTPAIFFEDLDGVTIDRTDLLGAAFEEAPNGSFTTRTTAANAGTGFSPTLVAGAKLYFGHANIMWAKTELDVQSASDVLIGAWEFYDGNVLDTTPDNITNIGGGQLRLEVNGLLGAVNRAGARVTVMRNLTMASETVTSTWNGTKNIVTIGLLGQSAPSFVSTDYTVGTEWAELNAVEDATENLSEVAVGSVEYELPQTDQRNWSKTTVNGFEGFFLRYRVVEVSSSSTPTIGRVRLDRGEQYAKGFVTQGRSVFNETLGSSNGDVNQRFATGRSYFILNSQTVRVDDEAWTEVKNFLDSGPQDKHYKIELGNDDRATIVFGDGTTGRIPPIGQANIVIDYRYDANNNGNVGANTITVDKTGLTYVNSVYNPRSAFGWRKAESADRDSLEQAKEDGPASLRIRDVAVSPEDLEQIVVRYKDENGASPFSRSKAIEEGFGPKTLEMVLLTRGGGLASPSQIEDIELYVNGDKYSTPPAPKRIVANQQAVGVNFQPRPVNVVVDIEAPPTVTQQQVTNALAAILQPEAKNPDGTWMWAFGAEIPDSRISHEIFNISEKITKVRLTEPAAPILLSRRELPTNGTFTVRIVTKL